MSKVTVIGLGAMGAALASAFLAHGHEVTVWNRSPQRANPLVAKGAARARSVAEALKASPLAVICVLDYAAVRDILESAPDRLAGRAVVNLTNGTPAQAREIAAWLGGLGADYIDGGIMVTPELVDGPEAFIFYGGSRATYLSHEKTLASLGRGVYVGDDAALAPLHDLALLSAMFGLFGGYLHAAALLRSERIPAADVTPMIASLLHAMIDTLPQTAREIDTGDYPRPTSNNAMMAAGLESILAGSRDQGVRTGLIEPIHALFARAATEGLGDLDISALVPLLTQARRARNASEKTDPASRDDGRHPDQQGE